MIISRTNVDYSLYLVTDRELCNGRSLIEVISEAVAGGVSVVQLREKDLSTKAFIELAREVKKILSPNKVPLIINDRLDVMAAAKADGIHVGQNDMSPKDIRNIVGHECIVGLSVNSAKEIEDAKNYDVDYIGLGPIFPTQTKTDTDPPVYKEGLAKARLLYPYSIVAIGGINASNAEEIFEAGADGIAVVSAICSAKDPMQAAAFLRSQKKALFSWRNTGMDYYSAEKADNIEENSPNTENIFTYVTERKLQ